jgi:2-(1,2-epoxy-1,2-dihydrophenyl)acetyl-CoA isomerase
MFIEFAIEQEVAFIRFNRPEKRNAFHKEMGKQMLHYLKECEHNTAIRCVYITGNGKAFCAGQDLMEVADNEDFKDVLEKQYNPLILQIRRLPKPVVAAVNGVAAGAGVNIALSCDIVVAAANASFVQAFSKIGLIPDCGGTYLLPRLIGWQKASALMLLGNMISAAEAEQLGMIYKVFPDSSFETDSKEIALQLAQMPTQALAFTKQALQASFHNSLQEQLELESYLQQKAMNTHDAQEGMLAFLQKRKPIFTGQ